MKPAIRVETAAAIQNLAAALNLPYNTRMQDWAVEVFTPASIEMYLNHYGLSTDDDEKFLLMQLIILAINDQENIQKLEFYWKKALLWLASDFAIHEFTVYYWCRFESKSPSYEWEISPYLQSFWADMKDV